MRPTFPTNEAEEETKRNKAKVKKRRTRYINHVFSIKVLIVSAVIFLVILAALISYFIQHFLLQYGINNLSDSIRDSVRIGVDYQVHAVFDVAKSVSKIDNNTFSYNLTNTTLDERLPYLKHLYSLLQTTDSIASVIYGDTAGNGVGTTRNAVTSTLQTNSTAEFAYYAWFAGENIFYAYTVEDDLSIGPLEVSLPSDVRSRPWYTAGLASPDGSYLWSDIYIGIRIALLVSISQPYFTKGTDFLEGVSGVQLTLPRLKDSLANLTSYSATIVILLTSEGGLILDSCPANANADPITCPGLVTRPLQVVPLNESDGVYLQINDYVIENYQNWSSVPSGATTTIDSQWITFQQIADRNLLWVAVIVIDSNAYLYQVNQANKFTIIGISVFSFVAALLAALVAIAVTKPIINAITQMNRISTMDFTKVEKKKKARKSKLYELNAMEKSLSKLRTAMYSFEKFVPNRVVKEILSRDTEAHLGVTPWNATVFFCDIEDFTTIAELMDPADLVSLLLNFLQEMSNIILEETHGTIDKFIGDAIMAFWNAPHPVENHAEMACAAALRCHNKIIDDLRPKWDLPNGVVLNARFGIHTGDMLIGNIGSLERINYTAIGDNVNIASRLESLCKFYQVSILISSAVHEQVKDRFLCRPLDMVIVRGKSRPFILFELVCEIEDATEEQIELCELQQNAANFVFLDPDPPRAFEAYKNLHEVYNDVSIERVYERLERLRGTDDWPGMECFDHNLQTCQYRSLIIEVE